MHTTEEIRFEGAAGAPLAGTLSLPDGTGPWPLVVAVHGASSGTRSFVLFEHLATLLPRRGIATFVYDRRGEGASGGKAGGSLTVLADDARAAVGMVSKHHLVDPRRIGLWGFSQGGWIAPMAAADNEEVAFLVAVSASGVSPAEQMTFATANLLRERGFAEEEVERATALRVQLNDLYRAGDSEAMLRLLDKAQRKPWFELTYLPHAESFDPQEEPFEIDLDIRPVLARLRVPVLLIYGETDRWVPIERSIDVWRSAMTEADARLTVARIPGAGHFPTLVQDPTDLDEEGQLAPEYERVITGWLTEVTRLPFKGHG